MTVNPSSISPVHLIQRALVSTLDHAADLIENAGSGLCEGRLEIGPLRIVTSTYLSQSMLNAFDLGRDRGRAEGRPTNRAVRAPRPRPEHLALVPGRVES